MKMEEMVHKKVLQVKTHQNQRIYQLNSSSTITTNAMMQRMLLISFIMV